MENKESTKDLFQELSPEQRIQALKDNALRSENTTVTRPYDATQLAEFKEKLGEASVKLNERDEEFQLVKDKYKGEVKPLVATIKECTQALTKKASTETEEVFLFDNQLEGTMEIYDLEGKFLYSRRLYENERQTNMLTMKHTGTQG